MDSLAIGENAVKKNPKKRAPKSPSDGTASRFTTPPMKKKKRVRAAAKEPLAATAAKSCTIYFANSQVKETKTKAKKSDFKKSEILQIYIAKHSSTASVK